MKKAPRFSVEALFQRELLSAKDKYHVALAASETLPAIRAMWKRLGPFLTPEGKKRAFNLVSVSIVHAFRKGYEYDKTKP